MMIDVTLACRAGTSMRVASRRFSDDTGLTLKAWRQWARVLWAVPELAYGKPISQLARYTGCARTAAFAHALRQGTSQTSGEFLAAPQHDQNSL